MSNKDWDPQLYTRFEDERTRPAAELLARVPLDKLPSLSPVAVDLGCGPGNSTALLVQRFPEAQVVGVDNSPAMLASARERLPQLPWVQGVGFGFHKRPVSWVWANWAGWASKYRCCCALSQCCNNSKLARSLARA